jgi:hypothetical protein
MQIKKDIRIDELIEMNPKAVGFLAKKGVHCIACGEPVWGTLEELVKQKGFNNDEIEDLLKEFERLKRR